MSEAWHARPSRLLTYLSRLTLVVAAVEVFVALRRGPIPLAVGILTAFASMGLAVGHVWLYKTRR